MKKNTPKPGRPPLPPALRTTGHTIRLTAAQWIVLRRIGDGNPSEGVRRLLAAAEKTA